MKIKCPFCDTEYKIDRASGPVKCAVCGHVWTPAAPRRNPGLVFFAAITALLAAVVFAVAITMHKPAAQVGPLIAVISEITTTTDDNDAPKIVVSGRIENTSDEIQGIPNLIIISKNTNGDAVATEKFMPPATLLEPGNSAGFTYTLGTSPDNVKKINVELSR